MALRNLLLHLPTLQICINVHCCTNVAWHLVLFNAKKQKKTEALSICKAASKRVKALPLLKHMNE